LLVFVGAKQICWRAAEEGGLRKSLMDGLLKGCYVFLNCFNRLGIKMKIKIITIIGLITVLSACNMANIGNKRLEQVNLESFSEDVIKGNLSKDDVKEILGNPSTVSVSSVGKTIWMYSLITSKADATLFIPIVGGLIGGVNSKSKMVTVIFEDGLAQEVTVVESNASTR
jgi:outer membrane protein assembly factor BamE (lipoprotein component of BamABCDE complex)